MPKSKPITAKNKWRGYDEMSVVISARTLRSILTVRYGLILYGASCKTPKYVIPSKAGIHRINRLQIKKMDSR